MPLPTMAPIWLSKKNSELIFSYLVDNNREKSGIKGSTNFTLTRVMQKLSSLDAEIHCVAFSFQSILPMHNNCDRRAFS